MNTIKYFALFLALLFSTSVYGQAWSGIIDPSRAIDYSSVGAAHINDVRTQCGSTVAPYGTSGSPASSATINSALAACPYNGFTQLGAGTFWLSNGITFPIGGSNSNACTTNCSNITLRGQYATGTSTTSNTIGTGALTFTTATSMGLSAGWLVYIQNTAVMNNGVMATVTSDTGTTLVVNATSTQGSGTFSAWTITVPTNLVFSGAVSAGNCSQHSICAGSTDLNYEGAPSNTATFSGASLTNTVTGGTYVQGGTFLSLSSVTNLSVGAPLILDMINDQLDTGGVYAGCELGVSIPGGQAYGDWSGACSQVALQSGYSRGTGSQATIRSQQQLVNVVAITGIGPFTVQVTPGIYAPNWATARTPQAWWATSPVYNDGVENLRQDVTGAIASAEGMQFFNCTGCWAKGFSSVITGSPAPSGWYHIGLEICNHCTIRDSYHYGYNGDVYGFTNSIGSDNLFENNIGQFPGEDFVTASDCEGCVATYNFIVNPLFSGSSVFQSQNTDYHGLTFYTLQEGNIGVGLYSDSFHGTHTFNTQFRNRWDGHEQNNGSATNQNTVALVLNPGSRFDNPIGNILGTPGYHTHYKALPGDPNTTLFVSVIGAGPYPNNNMNDGLVNPTTFYWGNWDTVTNAVRWCGNSGNTGWSTTCSSTSEVPTLINKGAVFNQQIGTGNGSTTVFSGTLSNLPLIHGNSSAFECITLSTSACGTLQQAIYANDTANGTFVNNGNTSSALSGTINYTTGAVTLTFATAPANGTGVWVNYSQQTSTSIPYSNAVPANQTLPASFIYSSKPSWWPSGKAWPTIGPDITGGNVGQCSGGTYNSSEVISSGVCTGGTMTPVGGGLVISNPAMDYYYNVMGGVPNGTGSPLPFSFIEGGGVVATPTFSPPGGGYTSAQTVTISCATPSAIIYYTLDGSLPNPGIHGSIYSTPITVSSSETIQAVGSLSGLTSSNDATAIYYIGVAPAPQMFGAN